MNFSCAYDNRQELDWLIAIQPTHSMHSQPDTTTTNKFQSGLQTEPVENVIE